MKKLIGVLIVLFGSIAWSSDKDLNLPFGNLQPFTTDSCTKFPNGTKRNPSKWEHCCIAHDQKYWLGGAYIERIIADRELYQCVKSTGEPDIALLMYVGVRKGGTPFLPTPWRWGYGWPKPRGYTALSEAELRELNK